MLYFFCRKILRDTGNSGYRKNFTAIQFMNGWAFSSTKEVVRTWYP